MEVFFSSFYLLAIVFALCLWSRLEWPHLCFFVLFLIMHFDGQALSTLKPNSWKRWVKQRQTISYYDIGRMVPDIVRWVILLFIWWLLLFSNRNYTKECAFLSVLAFSSHWYTTLYAWWIDYESRRSKFKGKP